MSNASAAGVRLQCQLQRFRHYCLFVRVPDPLDEEPVLKVSFRCLYRRPWLKLFRVRLAEHVNFISVQKDHFRRNWPKKKVDVNFISQSQILFHFFFEFGCLHALVGGGVQELAALFPDYSDLPEVDFRCKALDHGQTMGQLIKGKHVCLFCYACVTVK